MRYFLSLSLLIVSLPAISASLVVTADRMLDVSSGELINNAVVVIDENTIS